MILEIDNYLVSTDILTECFCCDYQECKGCCCVIGDSGAPLLENEIDFLKKQYCLYKPFLTKEGVDTIEKEGVSFIDSDGDLVTPLISLKGDCAYSYTTEDGFTLCAIERGWEVEKNKELLKKPISCWLYPIRVGVLRNGTTTLVLSHEHLCKEAFAKGKQEGIKVYKFLKEPLIHRFGEEFYEKLEVASKEIEKNM